MLAVSQTTSKNMRFFAFLVFLLVAVSVTEACNTGKTGYSSIRSSAAFQNPKPIEPAADIDATVLTTPNSSPSSSSSSFTATTTAASASVAHDFTTAEPHTTTGTTPATSIIRREGQDYICPHCDRTFTSRIGLVGHLRIHRTETGEPVPGAPTYTHRTRLLCRHCPRTFTHRMGLFGHMRIHDDLR
nr:unnamed protein product [Spirometra erinaceieuropaei]